MRNSSHRHLFAGGLCACGERAALPTVSPEEGLSQEVDTALLHGLFPDPVLRRTLLRSVGAATLLGALASILPVASLKSIAQERKPLEKIKLNVGFLPITCAAPLIYGEQLGSYAKEGLEVSLQKIAGIALIRDKMINGELDVSQQVMPVALTMTAGLGGNTQSIKVSDYSQPERQLAGAREQAQEQSRPEELARLHLRRAIRSEPPGDAASQLPGRAWARSREGRHLSDRAADRVCLEPACRQHRRLLRRRARAGSAPCSREQGSFT